LLPEAYPRNPAAETAAGSGRERNGGFGVRNGDKQTFVQVIANVRQPSADIQSERAWPFPTACLPCRIDFRPPVDFANEPEDQSDFR